MEITFKPLLWQRQRYFIYWLVVGYNINLLCFWKVWAVQLLENLSVNILKKCIAWLKSKHCLKLYECWSIFCGRVHASPLAPEFRLAMTPIKMADHVIQLLRVKKQINGVIQNNRVNVNINNLPALRRPHCLRFCCWHRRRFSSSDRHQREVSSIWAPFCLILEHPHDVSTFFPVPGTAYRSQFS